MWVSVSRVWDVVGVGGGHKTSMGFERSWRRGRKARWNVVGVGDWWPNTSMGCGRYGGMGT